MKFIFPLLVIFLCAVQTPFAQIKDIQSTKGSVEQTYELAIADAEKIDRLMPVMPGVGSHSRSLLDEKSVKPYLMPARNVGSVGQLWAYNLASLLEFYVNYDNNFKDNLSPDFISLSSVENSLENGLKFLADNGTVSAAIMPYESTTISPVIHGAKKFKIRQYLKIFNTHHNKNEKIFETRKALMRGHPILIKIGVNQKFMDAKNIKYWHNVIKNPDIEVSMLVVGYNHDLEAFELMCNWGSDWAENGFIFMDYADFGKLATEGIVIVPDRDF